MTSRTKDEGGDMDESIRYIKFSGDYDKFEERKEKQRKFTDTRAK